MKEKLLAYISERIDWHRREQAALKASYRNDEAAHIQITINVYNIFLSTWQAMKYDLNETLLRFSSIVSVWDENHRRAVAHHDSEKQFIEEIKIERAIEIITRMRDLERMHHD